MHYTNSMENQTELWPMIPKRLQKPLPSTAKKVFEGEIFHVWQWPQKLYDGSVVEFERLTRPNSAYAVGVLPDQKILLVEDMQPHWQFSQIAPTGGRVELDEDPAEAVRREFREETGYQIGQLLPWFTYDPSSLMQWSVHAFVGKDLLQAGPKKTDAGEHIQLLTCTFEAFLQLGRDTRLRDSMMRIILLEALLDRKVREKLHTLLYE
ncbi:MAG: hypothetical protein COT71_02830 [Candidatus Andersenbacteria bacterium CG10_big_fil_rev_8_21_14_0_10_54_11]|uniref:Nudix hydrolase domain-containing protein n=1 Tax=Candidatus Andersenbacteria bacterium CG10_big_fil_rev_8_21_14_0_10_54_11 TaxID=1974485 RepID=A0A2M6WZ64_9BACT|nr:MAG: hypothetical protein COT71_02830 [Candidatus Andersenbacteria bacterium CG10_big_fil_rev_8_21_14_0_10_54_11]